MLFAVSSVRQQAEKSPLTQIAFWSSLFQAKKDQPLLVVSTDFDFLHSVLEARLAMRVRLPHYYTKALHRLLP